MIRNPLFSIALMVVLFLFSTCFSESEEAQFLAKKKEQRKVKTIEIPTKQLAIATSAGANLIKPKVVIENNCAKINFDFSEAAKKIIASNYSGKDTFRTSIFSVQLLCNDKPIKHFTGWDFTNNHRLDSFFIFTSSQLNLLHEKNIAVDFPLYYLNDIKANTKAEIKIHVWQDYFLSDEKQRKIKIEGTYRTEYYRDTLWKSLINNTYSFSLTVPLIYRTDIVCDSIFLQNDKDWSPVGSDNTIWKSSLPDIYCDVSDEFYLTQNKSHIEKSCSFFNTPDTLVFYHYTNDDIFRLQVFDHDMLSRDDLLGSWKGRLSQFSNKQHHILKFGHVTKFYAYTIEKGAQN